MKKLIVILLLFLLFMVACSNKNESTDLPFSDVISQNDKKDDTDTITYINQINSDSVAYDGKRIFYINDNKIYTINNDGSEKSLFFEDEKISTMQIHNNKLYMLSFD